MKIKTVLTLFLFLLFIQIKAQDDPRNAHLNYLNYADFDMKISTVKEVSEVETKDGKVKPSNRNFKLIEVCLKGQNTSGAGLFIYKTAIFSAVYKYRGFYRVTSAKAVGVKPEIAPGQKIDVMISDADASMNNEMSTDGNEEFFVYFEIPIEVKEVQVQVPKLIKEPAKL
jgi:hypothetical protein